MKKFIPVNTPLVDGNEKKYIQECIDTSWISSEGSFVSEFEEKFAVRLPVPSEMREAIEDGDSYILKIN